MKLLFDLFFSENVLGFLYAQSFDRSARCDRTRLKVQ